MTGVDDAFSKLRQHVDAAAVAPPAARIATLGRRRRAGRGAVAGLTVLAVLTGGWSVLHDPDRPTAPILPAVSASVPAAPTPTGNRPERVPPGFLVGEAGGVGDTGNAGAEQAIDNHDYNAGCLGTPVARRSLALFFGKEAQRVQATQSLYVYADEDAAKAVMRDLRPRMRQCSGFGDAEVLQPVASPPLGAEALTVTVALPRDGAGEHTGEPYRFVVVRVGTAIAVLDGLGADRWETLLTQELVGRMCPYKATCAPPPSTVRAVKPVNGGEAWAVVADVEGGPVTEKAGDLGRLGYRASVVPTGCDVGSAAVLGGLPATSYTVVYFATEQDARSVAGPLGLPVVKVRTYCL
ncbi:hypothetical protein [Dactylosporangium sp. NPDC050588]|uniref:hypothetical protein n=1 Tax=Dactylosporangium sp. NPDC050588 TaxID=3157211 RepID=UPI003401E764